MKSFLAFHCHHDKLIEWVYNYDERVEFIKSYKPKGEQELRLRLFKLIPDDKIPGRNSLKWEARDKAWEACDKAWEACDKAREAYNKAWEAYNKAWEARDKAREACDKAREACDKAREAYDKAREAYNKAWGARDKAREACDKAWEAYLKKYQTEIESLHKELCPNCTWNGKTIFAEGRNK